MKERKRKEKNEDYEQGKSEKKHLIIKTKHAQKSGNQKKNEMGIVQENTLDGQES